jgi:hypothetical protein
MNNLEHKIVTAQAHHLEMLLAIEAVAVKYDADVQAAYGKYSAEQTAAITGIVTLKYHCTPAQLCEIDAGLYLAEVVKSQEVAARNVIARADARSETRMNNRQFIKDKCARCKVKLYHRTDTAGKNYVYDNRKKRYVCKRCWFGWRGDCQFGQSSA